MLNTLGTISRKKLQEPFPVEVVIWDRAGIAAAHYRLL